MNKFSPSLSCFLALLFFPVAWNCAKPQNKTTPSQQTSIPLSRSSVILSKYFQDAGKYRKQLDNKKHILILQRLAEEILGQEAGKIKYYVSSKVSEITVSEDIIEIPESFLNKKSKRLDLYKQYGEALKQVKINNEKLKIPREFFQGIKNRILSEMSIVEDIFWLPVRHDWNEVAFWHLVGAFVEGLKSSANQTRKFFQAKDMDLKEMTQPKGFGYEG